MLDRRKSVQCLTSFLAQLVVALALAANITKPVINSVTFYLFMHHRSLLVHMSGIVHNKRYVGKILK